jgi:hypothetical protein
MVLEYFISSKGVEDDWETLDTDTTFARNEDWS